MELHQLQYLVAVAEEANFTKAAGRLHVAQPGVSAQIRKLERELGHELLDRSSRAVRLTEVGAAVLPHARTALAAVADVRVAVSELTGLIRGQITVGSVTSHNIDLPGLLAGFHEDHPGVAITLSEANSEQLVEALQAGRLDAAIISVPGAAPLGVELHMVADEPLVAAVSAHHPLATRAKISVRDLRGRELISLPRGTGLRTCLEEACANAGFSPHIAFEASDPATLADLAHRSLGVAILPESITNARPQLHALAVTRPALRGRLAFAWRRHGPTSPAARALIERARKALPSAG